jgi:hypothetical protein
VQCCGAARHLADPAFDQIATAGESCRGAADMHAIGDHIVGLAAFDETDADCGPIGNNFPPRA